MNTRANLVSNGECKWISIRTETQDSYPSSTFINSRSDEHSWSQCAGRHKELCGWGEGIVGNMNQVQTSS